MNQKDLRLKKDLQALINGLRNRMTCYYKTEGGHCVWGFFHGFIPNHVPEFIEVVW